MTSLLDTFGATHGSWGPWKYGINQVVKSSHFRGSSSISVLKLFWIAKLLLFLICFSNVSFIPWFWLLYILNFLYTLWQLLRISTFFQEIKLINYIFSDLTLYWFCGKKQYHKTLWLRLSWCVCKRKRQRDRRILANYYSLWRMLIQSNWLTFFSAYYSHLLLRNNNKLW